MYRQLQWCLQRCYLCQGSFLVTRHTLAWKGLLVAVFSLSGYRYLGDGGTDRREIFRDGTYRSRTDLLPIWGSTHGGSPKSKIFGLNFGHLTADIPKTVSHSVTCQLELTLARQEHCKNVSHGAVHPPPPGECTRVWRVRVFLTHLLPFVGWLVFLTVNMVTGDVVNFRELYDGLGLGGQETVNWIWGLVGIGNLMTITWTH